MTSVLQQFQAHTQTTGRGLFNITDEIAAFIIKSSISQGLCHVFLQHTSASLVLCENADSQVQKDLEAFMCRLIPDGDPLFQHIQEGPDDMPSHVRSVLTQNSLTLPIYQGQLALGIWQGVFVWEHRLRGYKRKWLLTMMGN